MPVEVEVEVAFARNTDSAEVDHFDNLVPYVMNRIVNQDIIPHIVCKKIHALFSRRVNYD